MSKQNLIYTYLTSEIHATVIGELKENKPSDIYFRGKDIGIVLL